MRYFLLFFCFSLPIFSYADEENLSFSEISSSVTALEGLPSSIVNGCVCAISGLYVDHSVDFVLPGPENLVFERTYSSAPLKGSLGMGWNANHRDWLRFKKMQHESEDVWGCYMVESKGARFLYKRKYREDDQRHTDVLLSLVEPKGMTNGSSREISGRTNSKNNRVVWHPRNNKFLCYNGANDCRTFYWDKVKEYYGVSSETKVNGSTYRYTLHEDPFMHTNKIVCSNSRTKRTYSDVDIKVKLKDKNNWRTKIYLETSDDRLIKYEFLEHSYEVVDEFRANNEVHRDSLEYRQNYLSKVSNPSKPTEEYSYTPRNLKEGLLLCKKKLPHNRFLTTEYYTDPDRTDYIGNLKVKRNIFCVDRVKKLSAPVGTTEEPVVIKRFFYDFNIEEKSDGSREPSHGYTHVFDAYKHRTTYHYTSDQLLISIAKYSGKSNPALYSKEKFVWGKNANKGNLISKYLTDAKEEIYYLRNYVYDSSGNIIANRLYGNLTGRKNVRIALDADKMPNKDCECEIKRSTYSHDGLNLKLSETDSNGIKTYLAYEPNTDRVISRLQTLNEIIFLREFFEYDENNALSRKISDDGHNLYKANLQGVTQRYVVTYKNKTSKPIGLPKEEIHYCQDLKTREFKQLKRLVSEYTKEGRLIKQDTYDAGDVWCYSQEWDYDKHGNVIKEVNPLGEVVTKKYDSNDNLVLQSGPCPGYAIENSYDFMNRLILRKEIHTDGQEFTSNYAYDYLGNCVSSINFYGHETRYKYDDFNRLIAVYHPRVIDENGNSAKPIGRTEYDIAGYPVKTTDASGNITLTEYNIRGQPLCINYPDGTFERFFYRLDGKLEFKRSRDGIKTNFKLDALGRVVEETQVSSTGEFLKSTRSEYTGMYLTKSIDPQGLETHYSYDEAGRLVWVIKGTCKSQTLYDSLGRPCEIREFYGDEPHEYRASIKIHDLLDRLIEERLEDYAGNVFHRNYYEYDSNGNRTIVQNGDQVTSTLFNLHNNPIEIINAAGEVTHADYNYRFLNELGQFVLQTTTTDALGYQTVDTYDAANRLVKSEQCNPYGSVLTRQEIFYDLSGNKCRVEDSLIEDGEVKDKIATVSTYGMDNQITSMTEAFGKPEGKTTRYVYNVRGQLLKLVKPDGTEIIHKYDNFGRLQRQYTEAGTLDYVYAYNLLDQVVSVHDHVTGQKTEREYDFQGNLVKETFAHGHSIDYRYDNLGRAHVLNFPDMSSVEYLYNAVDLIEARRIVDGKPVYSHFEPERNLSGQVKAVIHPGENGETAYSYDSMGRCTSIVSEAYRQEVPSNGYDRVGNLRRFDTEDQHYEFDYDELNQLSSEKGHDAHAYRFDSLANRIEKDDEVHHYNALNQLVQKGSEKFKYDKNGDLIEREAEGKVTSYAYDVLDRLISIKQGENRVDYRYDPFNRRMAKVIGEEEQHFLYIGQEEIGLWQDGRCKEFRMLVKNEMSTTAAIELNNELYVPRHDLSGNIVCLTDKAGKVVERYRYTAFGESQVLDFEGKVLEKSHVGNSWQYSSKRRDSESGLITFGLRYYDTDLGRWLTPDPAGFEGGANLYAYIHNSPLVYKDRFGLWAEGNFFRPTSLSYEELSLSSNSDPSVIYWPVEKMLINNFSVLQGPFPIYSLYKRFFTPVEESENYCLDQSELAHIDSQTEWGKNMFGFLNGVWTEKSEFCADLVQFKKMTGGENVVGTHAASCGRVHDITRYLCSIGGIAAEAVQKIHALWFKHFKKHPNGYIFWVCHSRGVADTNLALKTFPKELRERIVIVAVAPAKYINPRLCKSVVHLVSTRDMITHADIWGMKRCMDTIEFINGSGPCDHFFMDKIYFDRIQKHCDNFKELYL